MLLDKKPYTVDRVVRITISVGLTWAVIWMLRHLGDVLIPFAVALLLAYLIDPLVVRIQRKVPHRGASVILSLVIVLVVIVGACGILLPMIGRELARMAKLVTALVGDSDLAARARALLPPDLWRAIRELLMSEEAQVWIKNDTLIKAGQTVGQKLLPGVWGVITGAASLVAGLVGLTVVLLYLIFLLLDFQKVRTGWKEIIPPAYRDAVVGFVAEFDRAMHLHFRGQAAVASIVGLLFALGFTLIGLPMGIVLALFIGVLNMVPYLQILGFFPALILACVKALETGGSIPGAIGLVCLVFAVVQAIQDMVLVPRIMGKVTGLSPWMIILSLSVWGKLFGIFGLLIALPMTCLLIAYYKRFVLSHVGNDQGSGPETTPTLDATSEELQR